MKRFGSMILATALLLTMVPFAEVVTPVPVVTTPAPVMTYTLETANQKLLEESLTLKLAVLDIEAAQVSVNETRRTADRLRDANDYGIASPEIYYAKKGVLEKQAALGLMVKEKTLVATETGLTIGLKQSFYGILSAQESLKIKEASALRLKELYDVSAKKYQLGLISKNTLNVAKVDYETSLTAVETAKRDLIYSKMVFNQTMNQPLEAAFELQGTLTYAPISAVDLPAKIALGLENRLDVVAAKEAKEIAEATYAVDQFFYGSHTYAYKRSYITAEGAKLDYTKALTTAELAIRNAYNDMIAAEKAYLDLKNTVALAKEGYEIAKTMYGVGMNTQMDVSQALIQYNNAENGLNAALLGLKLAEMQFEASYMIGLGQ